MHYILGHIEDKGVKSLFPIYTCVKTEKNCFQQLERIISFFPPKAKTSDYQSENLSVSMNEKKK